MATKKELVPFGDKKSPLSRNILLIGGAILGAALLLLSNLPSSTAQNDTETAAAASDSIEAYTRALEEKIRTFCEQVEGVSNVSVAVSLDSGYRRVYAQDGSSYILVGSGSSQEGIYLTDKTPEIGGIGIVCTGGGNPIVQQKLMGLLSAAYGVSSNKIYIAEAQK